MRRLAISAGAPPTAFPTDHTFDQMKQIKQIKQIKRGQSGDLSI
jgi:hypothetical protein